MGRGGKQAGAGDVERVEWSCSSPAPEPHYFWYPEGLVYLWFPSWGFWYYWERPVWLLPVSIFLLLFSQEHFMPSKSALNKSEQGNFYFSFCQSRPFQCPSRVLCPYLWRLRGRVLSCSQSSTPKGPHHIALGRTMARVYCDPSKAGKSSSWDSDCIFYDTKTVWELYALGTSWTQLHILLAHFLSSSCTVFSLFMSWGFSDDVGIVPQSCIVDPESLGN